jgi:hypothetical protein
VLPSVSKVEGQLGVEDQPVVMAEPGDPNKDEADSTGNRDAIE